MNKFLKLLTITIVSIGLTSTASPMKNILGSDTHAFGQMVSRQSGLDTVPDTVGQGGIVSRMMIWAATKAGAGFIAKHGVSAVAAAAGKLYSTLGRVTSNVLGLKPKLSTPSIYFKPIRRLKHRSLKHKMQFTGEVREITSREPSRIRKALGTVDHCVSRVASGVVTGVKNIPISVETGKGLVKCGMYGGIAYTGYRGLKFAKDKVVEMASSAWGIAKLAIGVAALIGIGVITKKVIL